MFCLHPGNLWQIFVALGGRASQNFPAGDGDCDSYLAPLEQCNNKTLQVGIVLFGDEQLTSYMETMTAKKTHLFRLYRDYEF